MIYNAAVDKIEEKRKPEDFIGDRKRIHNIPSAYAEGIRYFATQWAAEKKKKRFLFIKKRQENPKIRAIM